MCTCLMHAHSHLMSMPCCHAERYWGGTAYVKSLRASLDAAGFGSTQIILPDGWECEQIVKDAQADPDFANAIAGTSGARCRGGEGRRELLQLCMSLPPPAQASVCTTHATSAARTCSRCWGRNIGLARTSRPLTTGLGVAAGAGAATWGGGKGNVQAVMRHIAILCCPSCAGC